MPNYLNISEKIVPIHPKPKGMGILGTNYKKYKRTYKKQYINFTKHL